VFRARTIVLIALGAVLIYSLSPDDRKQRIRDRIREVWRALVISVAIYWVYMLALFAWKRWGR